MSSSSSDTLDTAKPFESYFPVVWHHPKVGIAFRVIQPLLRNAPVRIAAFTTLKDELKRLVPDMQCIAGIDSRGYIVSSSLAMLCNVSEVMIAKCGKLPGKVHSLRYDLEYGSNQLEVLQDAIRPGERVVIADDLLATGGSALAAAKLVERCGGVVAGFVFLGTLPGCGGTEALSRAYPNAPVVSLCQFPSIADPDPIATRRLQRTTLPIVFDPTVTYDTQYVVLAHPSMYQWAMQLVRAFPHQLTFLEMHWKHFADGQLDLRFPQPLIEDRHVIYLMSSHDLSSFYEQLAFMRILPRHVKSLHCWLPYCASLTHERVDRPQVMAAAEPMLKLLSAGMPSTECGVPKLCIADIHALPTGFYATDDVRMKVQISAIPVLMRLIDREHTTIGLPDDGAKKRFHPLLEEYKLNMVWCGKVRGEGEQRTVRIVDNNFPGSWNDAQRAKAMESVLLIDDICNSGSTLYQAALAFRAAGAKHVSCFVTHGVFPKEAYKRFMPGGEYAVFDTFYVTDTIPEVSCKLRAAGKPFYVIPFAAQFARQAGLALSWQSVWRSFHIVCCSHSAVKKRATEEAMQIVLGSDTVGEVRCEATESGVPKQPMGHEEILSGARRRAEKSKHCPYGVVDQSFIIGMENGGVEVIDPETGYLRMACVGCVYVIHSRSGKPDARYEGWTEPVIIGDDEVVSRVKASNGRVTFGELLAAKHPPYPADDWHQLYGPKSRVQLLKETLVQVLFGYA